MRKQKKKKRYVSVPVIMQLETPECGAACLAMVLAFYKKWLPLEEVRRGCGVSRDGSNARNIMLAAQNYGLEAKAYRFELQDIKESVNFPCIVHWNFNHFVVLCGFKGGKALINDPARGKIWISEKEFDEAFTGVCLCFKRGTDFEKSGRRLSIFEFAKERLKGSGTAIAFIIAAAFLASAAEIISLSFSGAFADFILSGNGGRYLTAFITLLCTVGIVWAVILGAKEAGALKINGKFAACSCSTFMWKVLHMPMEFFSQRMAGDIQERMVSGSSIAFSLINIFAPIVLDAAMLVLYLAIMLKYSVGLTLIGIASVFINILLCGYATKKRTNILRVMLRDEGKLAGITVSGIEMIETIKSGGAENSFFEKWSGISAGVNAARTEYLKIDCRIGILPELVSALAEVIVLSLGVWLIMNNRFTIGMLLAFGGFLTAFSKPARKIIAAGESAGELRCDIERIGDVMNYPEDIRYEADDKREYDKLSGSIELSGVTFGYSPLDEPLIKNFSMKASPGQRIAIVGASGCGKSTVAKLIAGLYKPSGGSILFDGKPIDKIDKAEFTGSVAVVDQEVTMFADSVANNIKMWDNSIEDFEMILACRDAGLHDMITERDGGYNCEVYENGKNFSGGEKQRLEIARALAQDPTIIVMDEATSALDSVTEHEVIKSISERGITCIIIAHRLSAIRDCDNIIVMENGTVAESGTHDELYRLNGVYTKLISSE